MTNQANIVRRDVRGDPKSLSEYRASIVAEIFYGDLVTLLKTDGRNFAKQLRIQQENIL